MNFLIHIATFLPNTLSSWAAVVGALAAIGATAFGIVNRNKIHEVHMLVNSRLDLALKEIDELKTDKKVLAEEVVSQKAQEVIRKEN